MSLNQIKTIALSTLIRKKRAIGAVYEEMLFKREKEEDELILFYFLRDEIIKLNTAIYDIRRME